MNLNFAAGCLLMLATIPATATSIVDVDKSDNNIPTIWDQYYISEVISQTGDG